MSTTTPTPTPHLSTLEVRQLLLRLARRRCENLSWAKCAEEFQMDAARLENLTAEHPEIWQAARRDAYQELTETSYSAAVVLLTKQMEEHEDPKQQREAAKALGQLTIKAWPKLVSRSETARTRQTGDTERSQKLSADVVPAKSAPQTTAQTVPSVTQPTPVEKMKNTIGPLPTPFRNTHQRLEQELRQTAVELLAAAKADPGLSDLIHTKDQYRWLNEGLLSPREMDLEAIQHPPGATTGG